jgi:hypothetical protein
VEEGVRFIVCGGRDYDDYDKVAAALQAVHAKVGITMIIHGGSRGADTWGGLWADVNLIPHVVCPANWDNLDSRAGPARNGVMLLLNPDGVIAFPGGKGTANMVEQAKKAGVKVMEIKE